MTTISIIALYMQILHYLYLVIFKTLLYMRSNHQLKILRWKILKDIWNLKFLRKRIYILNMWLYACSTRKNYVNNLQNPTYVIKIHSTHSHLYKLHLLTKKKNNQEILRCTDECPRQNINWGPLYQKVRYCIQICIFTLTEN